MDTLLLIVAPKQSNVQPHVACTTAKTGPIQDRKKVV